MRNAQLGNVTFSNGFPMALSPIARPMDRNARLLPLARVLMRREDDRRAISLSSTASTPSAALPGSNIALNGGRQLSPFGLSLRAPRRKAGKFSYFVY